MRRIMKNQTPECLQRFIDVQLKIEPKPVNLTYACFPYKRDLLAVLTSEQFGLCGYTGAPVDERISSLKGSVEQTVFSSHIEHLKSQRACKQELVNSGCEYGRDLSEDLDYFNMIAALEVRGIENEHFGAVKKKDIFLPVLPTQDQCNKLFRFRAVDGGVEGLSDEAKQTIDILQLDHDTLKGWRKAAVEAWFDLEVIKDRDDFEKLAQAMEKPVDGKLPEYAFVIGSIARESLR